MARSRRGTSISSTDHAEQDIIEAVRAYAEKKTRRVTFVLHQGEHEKRNELAETNQSGEIVVDDECRTSVPRIFACGDVTNVPYEQIVVAMGEGSKAALTAFEYLLSLNAAERAEVRAA